MVNPEGRFAHLRAGLPFGENAVRYQAITRALAGLIAPVRARPILPAARRFLPGARP